MYDISKTKIFLSSVKPVNTQIVPNYKPYYVLESFLGLRAKTQKTEEIMKWFLSAKMFILDSGAYTFMCKPRPNMDFDKYVDDYISFINKYDIEYFFEMDVDNILGYEKVLELRKRIEDGTGKKVIPVWHKSRGKDEFVKMCEEYDYVAIGGIASREIKPSETPMIYELCEIAHEKGCLIHGLGYLKLQQINTNTCPFDTVDGSSWQGHMRGSKFVLEYDNELPCLKRLKDNPRRNWKPLIKECYEVWTEYSMLKG